MGNKIEDKDEDVKVECPVCKVRFAIFTDTDWDIWLEHLVEEKRTIFDSVLNTKR